MTVVDKVVVFRAVAVTVDEVQGNREEQKLRAGAKVDKGRKTLSTTCEQTLMGLVKNLRSGGDAAFGTAKKSASKKQCMMLASMSA